MSKIARYRIYEDAEGTGWAAESEAQLREYDSSDAYCGNVEWPVKKLSESEIDARKMDLTMPDADKEAPDFKPNIVSLREHLMENIYGSTGVQCVYEEESNS